MGLNLDKWTKDWTLMSRLFRANEIALISERIRAIKTENIVFCSFENRFARSGGLAAVTLNILPHLKDLPDIRDVVLLTPFYPKLMDKSGLKPAGLSFKVPYNKLSVPVDLYEYTWNYAVPRTGIIKEYYMAAEGFFESGNKLHDPYSYSRTNGPQNDSALRDSALFFCKATPLAMKALGIRENIIFHLQEWQTALIALTAKVAMLNNTLISCGTVQTMHNSYDSFIPFDFLSGIAGNNVRQKMSTIYGDGLTAYQTGLQLIDSPVVTVSENFAAELTTDIMQTEYFAPHLQDIFRKSGVYGVNNGIFTSIIPEYAEMDRHTVEAIRTVKMKKRKDLIRVLSDYNPPERFGDLTYRGKTITRLPDNVPILVMSGRYDPMQKGYDVLLRAVEKFTEDEIKVIVTPLTIRASDLDYFFEVACKCKGNLTVFPMRMEKGYHELQTGATFGIMPSIYEPFGAAVEYMANGTVNIGRATGGLIDQIDSGCGFLFREDAVFSTVDNIRNFFETGNIVQARKLNPWVQSMADNLYETIKKAVYVYQYEPDSYYRLIINGFRKIDDFSWESNAQKYFQVYQQIRKI